MHRTIWQRWIGCMVMGFCCPPGALGQAGSEDKAAIEKSVASYVAAFNRSDAKALAQHWSPEAVYTNPSSGQQVTGRQAIEQEFASILEEMKGSQLAVQVRSIDFISPNVAVEQGDAIVTRSDGMLENSQYSAVHVKQSGKWLLDRVTEAEETSPPSHYEQLKGLEWMIGTWVDADQESNLVETTCQWSRNNNFLVRSFKVVVEDRIDTSGMQFIGWDAAEQKIRSWAFDSDGGFAVGEWKEQGDRWMIESNSTLPDGRKGSAINMVKAIDKNTFSWQSTGREVDGKILPNIDELKVVRVGVPE